MASNKVAERLFYLGNRLPVRKFVVVSADDACRAACAALNQQARGRTMASAAQALSPEEKGSEVTTGERSSLSRGSPFGVLDVFDSFFPNRSLRSMIDTMDRVFDDPFLSRSRVGGRHAPSLRANARPPWDFAETTEAFRMRLDLPGLSKEEVKVYVEDGNLVIKGEHSEESKAEEDQWSSRSYGNYSTRIALPENASSEQIKAELKNGVLSVTIPKVSVEPKKTVIDVNVD